MISYSKQLYVRNLYCLCACLSTLQYLRVDPSGSIFRLLHSSIEVNGQHVLRSRFLPGVSMPQPIICLLHLQEGEITPV